MTVFRRDLPPPGSVPPSRHPVLLIVGYFLLVILAIWLVR